VTFQLAIEHDAVQTLSPHRTHEDARAELFAHLEATGCDHIAQVCPGHTTFALTDVADDPSAAWIVVGLAVIANLGSPHPSPRPRGGRG
jgi:hypothetical protein